MQNAYQKFEFEKILETLSSFCLTEQGKNLAKNTSMYLKEEDLAKALNTLSEMRFVLAKYDSLPIEVSSSLEIPLSLASKGGTLNIQDLERIANDILISQKLVRYFSKVNEAPLLKEMVLALPNLSYLEKDIHRIISPELTIFDNASSKLKNIRLSISRLESTMKKKIGELVSTNREFLTDSTLTLKNGHYALPVANAYKRKVKGLIQDVSSSGETTFIEPEIIVNLNNKMASLLNDERLEIHHLLSSLSNLVRNDYENISKINQVIGLLDFNNAKCKYCDLIKGTVPFLIKERTIDFVDARHPLIDPNKVVPNDFYLNEDKRVIVLSGPNSGGKTVALKTVGLLLLMAETALPIPAKEGASFSYFDHIYVDIGDNQSLSDNLSTFSAHLKTISEILSCSGGKDLVLLDELGTGTSPKEGEALAYSILTYLLKRHSFTMVSSHFEGLKAFALREKHVLNASMVFDQKNLVPTYRLERGLPGESYGLELAKRYSFPKEVLSNAENYLEKGEDLSVREAITKLEEVTRENSLLKEELVKEKAALELKKNELSSKEKALALKEDKFNNDLSKEKEKLLSSYEEKLNDIIANISSSEVKLHQVIKAKKDIEDLENKESKQPEFFEELKEGDYVYVPSLFLEGRLTSLNKERAVVTTNEGLTFKLKKNQLRKSAPPKETITKQKSGASLDEIASKRSVSLECNLIGMHYDEAKFALEKYLDDCLLRHYKRVRIIHGFGNGVLRNMVLDVAHSHPEFIDHIEAAQANEGGGGATIIYLK